MSAHEQYVCGLIHPDESNMLWKSSDEDWIIDAENYKAMTIGLEFWAEAVYPSSGMKKWYIRDDFWGDRTFVLYLNSEEYSIPNFVSHLQKLLNFSLYATSRIILVLPKRHKNHPVAIYPNTLKLGSTFEKVSLSEFLSLKS